MRLFCANKIHSDDSGFTLIEVLTVAAMIGILATVALASMHRSREAAFEAQALGALKTLSSMEYVYFFDHREFATWDQLKAAGDLLDADYVRGDNLDDPYDHPIAMNYSIQMFVNSTGSDFTIYAIPQSNPHYSLRGFSIYADGSIYGAGYELGP